MERLLRLLVLDLLSERIDETPDPRMVIEMVAELHTATEMADVLPMAEIEDLVETEVTVAETVARSIVLHDLHTANPRHCPLALTSTLETFSSMSLAAISSESLGNMELSNVHSLRLMRED